MELKLPKTGRRKALFVIDVQPNTMQLAELRKLIPLMVSLIQKTDYDAFVDANYFSDHESMFFKQNGFIFPIDQTGPTAPDILEAIAIKGKPQILVQKNTRSCFKGKNAQKLHDFLTANKIEENHFIGFDINDCVLGSAYDSIDLGYYSYVLEELSHIHNADAMMKNAALAIFRMQNMTNHSNDQEASLVRL